MTALWDEGVFPGCQAQICVFYGPSGGLGPSSACVRNIRVHASPHAHVEPWPPPDVVLRTLPGACVAQTYGATVPVSGRAALAMPRRHALPLLRHLGAREPGGSLVTNRAPISCSGNVTGPALPEAAACAGARPGLQRSLPLDTTSCNDRLPRRCPKKPPSHLLPKVGLKSVYNDCLFRDN